MNSYIFNTCLLVGLACVMVGVALVHSVGAALIAGGLLLVGVTLLLARWAGVASPHAKDRHVSH